MDRLSTADYFREALVVLSEGGSEALTIAVLCDRLSVTKGSFYHHFGGLPGFVDQLVTYWETEFADPLVGPPRARTTPSARLAALLDLAVELPHETEAAVRAWGRSRPDLAEAVARVDRRRERHLTDAVAGLGVDRAPARLVARMAVNLVVGAQQRENPVDRRRLRRTLGELTKLAALESDARLAGRLAHLV